MANPDIQKVWEERIQNAKKIREDWSRQFKVELARDYFAGRQNPGYPDHEWITVNKIYSHLMAQLPTLYNVDPYFYIKTKKSYVPDPNAIVEFDRRAKVRQSMLNYLKGELKLKPKARLGIQDAHFAYGALKIRYAADQRKNPDAGKPILSGPDKDGKQLPLTGEDGSQLIEPDFIPINERYEIMRVHPDDILWDEDAGPLDDKWGFIAERIRMTRADARRNPRFKKKALKNIGTKSKTEDDKKKGFTGAITSFFSTPVPTMPEEEKDSDIITTWEIYDLRNKTWLTIAENAEEPLMKPTSLPPGIEDHPYSILRFTLQDNTPYPIPPVSQAMDPQKELNLARSRILTHRKRFNRKYEVNVNALEDADTEISKLESGEDGAIIRVRQTGAVNAIKDAPLDQQGYLEVQALQNDITETFGSPGSSRGIAEADSATEAGILNQRMDIREGDRMSMVVDWIVDAAKKLDQVVQANITQNEAVKVSGPQGEIWEQVRVEDYASIAGEFEYSVNMGSTTPRLPDIERSQWLAFMSQVVIPMPHVLTAPRFMKKMAELFHIEDDASLEELRQIGLQIMSGQVPGPGNTGNQKGDQDPVTATLGAALGALGGNANGGGASGGLG